MALFFVGAATVFSGCTDFNQDNARECLADRRCALDDPGVCGVDGVEYECAAMARCYLVEIDDTGQACASQPQCEPVTCEMYCEYGFKTDDTGCEVCECRQEPAQCEPVACRLYCEHGFATDENGCEICECEEETQGESCGDDVCVSYHCGSRVPSCIKESELATMGACPLMEPGRFQEPDQQCVCDENTGHCRSRNCTLEEGCPSEEGLCVTWPDADDSGYCVSTTCDAIERDYEEIAANFNACNNDDDCTLYSPIYDCCGGLAVNTEGMREMGIADDFAARTQCGRDWAETCTLVDCAVPPSNSNAAACVRGRCQHVDF